MAGEAPTVVDCPDRRRFELRLEDRAVGTAAYDLDGSLLALTHTEVDPSVRGRGLGTHLVRAVLDDARRRGRSVLPVCPFVRRVIARHPDEIELVPVSVRARFGLADDRQRPG